MTVQIEATRCNSDCVGCRRCDRTRGFVVPEAIVVPTLLPYADPCPCDGDHLDPDWVAAAEPCQTCNDSARPGWRMGFSLVWKRCPDCLDGKPTLPIVVECDHSGSEYLTSMSFGTACDRCKSSDGWVPTGLHATIDLVPVVVLFPFAAHNFTEHRDMVIVTPGKPTWLMLNGQAVKPLDIDCEPGDTVAIIGKVTHYD